MAPPEVRSLGNARAVYASRAASARGKMHRAARMSHVLVVTRHVRQFVERNGIIVFVLQKIVIAFDRDILVIEQDVIRFDVRFGRFGLGLGLRAPRLERGTALAAGQFDLDDLTRIRADHGRFLQVVETLAGGRANTLYTPFFVGHEIPFLMLGSTPVAITAGPCQSLCGGVWIAMD